MATAYKAVGHDLRSNRMGDNHQSIQYVVGETYEGDHGIYAYDQLDAATEFGQRRGGLVLELAYDDDDDVIDRRERFSQRGRDGGAKVLRLRRCRVTSIVGQIEGDPDQSAGRREEGARWSRERVATMRAEAIVAGRRHLSHEQDDELGRLVHQKVRAAGRQQAAE
jgi:hypothetical protein